MSEAVRRIVVRRRSRHAEAHHGGSWKIALADFMTALMALFLVLWMISTATPQQLQGLAEYFRTPLNVAMTGGDRSTASTSAIPGGGDDPAHAKGEQARIDLRDQTRPAEMQRQFLELQRRIESTISADDSLRELRQQMRFDVTPEGLRIQLLDTDPRPMFHLGSDQVAPYMRELLRTLAPLLNDLPNPLSITGHTDSVPYANGERGYSNWELSADRANASRRELITGGLAPDKLLRVAGLGDRVPMAGSHPGDPVNRRITLLVLNEQAARRIRAEGEPASRAPLQE
ncbi:flagellar motor protein MotB [Alcanivorax balearicus MACL04]|uniref:Flagellar motor protein MotB n=1 Tax=Alloalcanivorax balearicus MACL04 TaxID=1177182 RepID=A0ABT2R396_9GAMM|nr:flagellar motor protein MotB [Alloalcanivorax balearicus]MCU5784261.1 flagellar motor protein MotB [Alloalcanivorax balearicus MACL04]